MKLVRFRSVTDYDEEILDKGDHHIRADLGEVLVFIRPGRRLPLAKPAGHVAELDMKDLTFISFE